MIENVPRVTSLYTPLNLTRMDVALGGRATVERVKWKSRSCLASGHTQMLCRESETPFTLSPFFAEWTLLLKGCAVIRGYLAQ